MKSLIAILRRIVKIAIPNAQPSNINEEVEGIKHLIENTHISNSSGHSEIGGGLLATHGPFTKVVDNSCIVISDARQYVRISHRNVTYGYKSKYQHDWDRHHLELKRNPWIFLQDASNITPGILLTFLKEYDKEIQKIQKKK